ncbi:hypothetical protein CCP2SC5_320011 [Azospirillaceae bacterium]
MIPGDQERSPWTPLIFIQPSSFIQPSGLSPQDLAAFARKRARRAADHPPASTLSGVFFSNNKTSGVDVVPPPGPFINPTKTAISSCVKYIV